MKVKEILNEVTFTSHLPYNPQSDAGPYNMSDPGNEYISSTSEYGEQEEDSENTCPRCHGTGIILGGSRTCPRCQGTGEIRGGSRKQEEQEEEGDEDFHLCGQCNGTGEGQYDGSRCGVCKGSGVIDNREQEDPDDQRDRMRDAEWDGSGPDPGGWSDD